VIRVFIEVDAGPVDLHFEFDDTYITDQESATQRVLELTAKAESAMVAALNAPPRLPSTR
jgi:hypothetical protein